MHRQDLTIGFTVNTRFHLGFHANVAPAMQERCRFAIQLLYSDTKAPAHYQPVRGHPWRCP